MPPGLPVLDSHVPIVGQPIRILDYTVIVQLQCQCQPKSDPLQLLGQGTQGRWQRVLSTCPHCQASYGVHSLEMHDGQLQFNVEIAPAKAMS